MEHHNQRSLPVSPARWPNALCETPGGCKNGPTKLYLALGIRAPRCFPPSGNLTPLSGPASPWVVPKSDPGRRTRKSAPRYMGGLGGTGQSNDATVGTGHRSPDLQRLPSLEQGPESDFERPARHPTTRRADPRLGLRPIPLDPPPSRHADPMEPRSLRPCRPSRAQITKA